MSRVITIEPYNSHWVNAYNDEMVNLKDAFPEEILFVHHIGSTSVPGLAAKPIIDILLEIKNMGKFDENHSVIESLGYTARGEYGIPGRRYFIKGGDNRTHHIHAFETGCFHITRHLVFRNYLRRHNDVAHQYAEIKYQAARACGNSSEIYCQLKNEFILLHEKLALKELSPNENQ
ncbi:GrpB family protein [Xenorhabdus bovienii]|uniref:GrpB family protein n=1 Tax=Xenorhabdus bovienii TaxID=40576 RepID=A0A0B6X6B0_XENBV|nr:GrpB family protein [Xenorhabdus bovienii]CDM89437.1 conserved protein of unknown function [Xenorhabdus bovienii]